MFKDKKSKFWGYAIPLNSEAELKMFIEKLKNSHHNANHFCYAWQIGVNPPEFRYNDDGEPNNTAGAPIYGQIQSFELTQIGIVVLRIFGGVKLGPGGLISAYKTAAKGALELSNIISVSIKIPIHSITYDHENYKKRENIYLKTRNSGTVCSRGSSTCKIRKVV